LKPNYPLLDAPHPHALPLRPMKNTTTSSLSRRALLQTGTLAAAATLLPATTQAQAPVTSYAPATLKPPTPAAELPVRLGIASYTFRSFGSQQQLIDFMKQLRTPFLNLKSMHLPMSSADLVVAPPKTSSLPVKDVPPIMIPLDLVAAQAAAYRAAGFKLTAAGNITFDKDDDADIRSKFEYIKAAGIPIIVCAPTHQNLPRLEKFVKEYNIKLAIHNHGTEDKNFPSPFDVLAAVKKMDPRIGLCIDLGHALRAGADVIAAIHAAGPRLYDIHIKDLADVNSRESQVAVGEGVMPVRAIFQALIDIRYAGNVDLEYEIHGDDPMPGVVESFAYMRGVLAGMGYR
jgi:sugar phosphate isomerase/epimerase